MGRIFSGIGWEGELMNTPVGFSKKNNNLVCLIDRCVPVLRPDKSDRATGSKIPPRSLQRKESKLWSLYMSAKNHHGRNSSTACSA